ncbi:MAG TPA: hypothetical protein VM536_05800, partial [Chloroflexia bacterium]|nr:hypothetical protein [Chloroflexia bacterium]
GRYSFTIGVQPVVPSNTPGGTAATPVPPPPPPPPPAASATAPPAPTQQATIVIQSVNDVRIFKATDRSEVSPGETVRYTITLLNAGTAAATNARLTDDVPSGLLVDLPRSNSTLGSVDLKGNSFAVNLGTIQSGQRITVTIVTSVIGKAGDKMTNTARLIYDQTPGGLTSNAVDLTVSAAGTPQAHASQTAVIQSLTPKPAPKATPKATPKPTTTAGGGNITSVIPKTGGEFPMLGLLLGLAMLVTRHLRLRNQAAAPRA